MKEKAAYGAVRAGSLVAGAFAALAVFCAPSARAEYVQSDSAFVFTHPERSYFWHTATNSTIALPVVFPADASSATLTVKGVGYGARYTGIAADEYVLTLPAASRPAEENVYDLVLEFDNGTVRTARLGVVRGIAGGGEAATRCIPSIGSWQWGKVENRATIPIPCGTTSFSLQVAGESEVVDAGLGGEAGWYAFVLGGYRTASLAISGQEGSRAASLKGTVSMAISIR